MQDINGIFAKSQHGQQAAAAATTAAAQAQAQQPPVFALTKGQINQGQLVDYNCQISSQAREKILTCFPGPCWNESTSLDGWHQEATLFELMLLDKIQIS